jgi:hypothetical protein
MDPAPSSLGGFDQARLRRELCRTHHRGYATGQLELLPHLEPQWRVEVATPSCTSG